MELDAVFQPSLVHWNVHDDATRKSKIITPGTEKNTEEDRKYSFGKMLQESWSVLSGVLISQEINLESKLQDNIFII